VQLCGRLPISFIALTLQLAWVPAAVCWDIPTSRSVLARFIKCATGALKTDINPRTPNPTEAWGTWEQHPQNAAEPFVGSVNAKTLQELPSITDNLNGLSSHQSVTARSEPVAIPVSAENSNPSAFWEKIPETDPTVDVGDGTLMKRENYTQFLSRSKSPMRVSLEGLNYRPNWSLFDQWIARYHSSSKSPREISNLMRGLAKNGRAQFEVELRYKTPSGQIETVRDVPSEIIEDEHGEKELTFYEKPLKIPVTEIDPASIRVTKRGIPESIEKENRMSKIAEKSGISALFHQIGGGKTHEEDFETTFQILKSGQLLSKDRFYEEDPRPGIHGVQYLGFRRANALDPHDSGRNFVMDFDTSLLDRHDYYVNPKMDWGYFKEQSIRFDETEQLRTFLYDRGIRAKANQSEAVFLASIPIRHLKNLYMSAGDRTRMLARLHQEHVPAPNGRTWEDIIVLFPR
jgi:hypothetical protein